MTSFGESHGPAMGVVLDGVPPGLEFSLENLKQELKKRAPGTIVGTTSRTERDEPEILSGIFEGKTLGTPVAIIIRNENQRSADYDTLKDSYRPGHADRTTIQKYGIRDHRGGGRASARETVARVVAGYFASLIVPKIKVRAFVTQLGPFRIDDKDLSHLDFSGDWGPYSFPQTDQWSKISEFLLKCKEEGESVGGKITVVADHCPSGLGEPVFDKLKADFAKAFLSIPACVSFSYGLGQEFAELKGSEISSEQKNFGGMEGGISSGERLWAQLVFKAPSTIGEKARAGRHDPCVLPRAVPVVEAMMKIVIADHYLRQRAYER